MTNSSPQLSPQQLVDILERSSAAALMTRQGHAEAAFAAKSLREFIAKALVVEEVK